MIELLGSELLSTDGAVATADALKGKTVGLYFSAHWCGPCRGFTPKLAEIYKGLKAAGKPFEIVFVSSDKDEAAFKDYFGDQPWLALPFSDRKAKAALSKKFKVQGIPTLVILDEEGGTITADGREALLGDPAGAKFPWRPPTLWEALGEEVINYEGEASEVSDICADAEVLALYFSAHWCPPCRGFTPTLCKTYEKVVADGKKMACVFVSSDRDSDAFREYLGSMPRSWFAIPPSDKRKEQLSKLFEVQGIPSLVLLDAKTGKTINANARGAVSADPEGANFPWEPPAVQDLSSPDGINESTSLCVMLDGCSSEDRAAVMEWLTPIAVELKAAGDEMIVFAASSGDGPVPQVRKLLKLDAATSKPQIAMLDIPDDGAYYKPAADGPLTADSTREFIAAFKAGTLTRLQLEK
jgi:nucleoredoxin